MRGPPEFQKMAQLKLVFVKTIPNGNGPFFGCRPRDPINAMSSIQNDGSTKIEESTKRLEIIWSKAGGKSLWKMLGVCSFDGNVNSLWDNWKRFTKVDYESR